VRGSAPQPRDIVQEYESAVIRCQKTKKIAKYYLAIPHFLDRHRRPRLYRMRILTQIIFLFKYPYFFRQRHALAKYHPFRPTNYSNEPIFAFSGYASISPEVRRTIGASGHERRMLWLPMMKTLSVLNSRAIARTVSTRSSKVRTNEGCFTPPSTGAPRMSATLERRVLPPSRYGDATPCY
jgi:hypothetical protein